MSRTDRGVAVISGAGSGIGAAVARALAARGSAVALLGRRRAPLASLASELAGAAFPVDVRDADALDAVARRVADELGAVEIVVAAAGVARVGRLDELDAAAVRESIDTNLLGTALLFRAFLPGLRERGRGTLVPILSVAARRGFPNWSAYCAAKWGTLGLVEALREELAGTGVRLVALTPGATETPLWDDVEGEWERSKMIPPKDVARALVWALDAGDGVAIEEIRMQPPGGNL